MLWKTCQPSYRQKELKTIRCVELIQQGTRVIINSIIYIFLSNKKNPRLYLMTKNFHFNWFNSWNQGNHYKFFQWPKSIDYSENLLIIQDFWQILMVIENFNKQIFVVHWKFSIEYLLEIFYEIFSVENF